MRVEDFVCASCLGSLAVVLLADVARSTSYSSSLSISDDYYATISIGVGTPSQTFDVLLDTLNSYTWVFNKSANLSDDQSGFDSIESSTWVSQSGSFSYTYENGSTSGTTGKDTLVISSLNLTSERIGLGSEDDSFFKDLEVSGALSLCRTSDVVSKLSSSDVDEKITINIDSKKVHFGSYSGSYSNSTEMDAITSISSISDYWSFSFDAFSSDGTASLLSCGDGVDCYGVIDSASPYLSFALSSSDFSSLWKNIAGSSSNCQISTMECDSEDDIAAYLYITIGNDTFYMERSDYYYDDKLHILRVNDSSYSSTDRVVFFGRPFLKTLEVALDAQNDTLTFSYTESSSSSDKWTTVWIVAGCVVAFAIIFFGIYFWKFKIPPPTRGTHEEQVSLLRSQPGHGQPHQPLGPQQARAAAATQSGPAPGASSVATQAQAAQALGSSTGAAQTSDPDEIRRRRLQFLESQQQAPGDDE